MHRWLSLLLVGLVGLLTSGCLNTLPHEPAADRLVAAAAAPLTLPVRESQPTWLLRTSPGWQGAHTRSLGGSEQDGAAVIVRVAIFADATAAHEAFVTLTPARLYHIWRHRMAVEPQPVPASQSLDGDEAQAMRYTVRGASRDPEPAEPVEMVVVRARRAVLVMDYIGLTPARLAAAVAAFVAGAARQ